MHLFLENIAKSYIELWKGTWRKVDNAKYAITNTDWEDIGSACVAANKTLPSIFGKRIRNIHTDYSAWTAEVYSIFILVTGPIVMRDRWSNQAYYHNFMRFSEIFKGVISHQLSGKSLKDLHQHCLLWVQEYETCVYSGSMMISVYINMLSH